MAFLSVRPLIISGHGAHQIPTNERKHKLDEAKETVAIYPANQKLLNSISAFRNLWSITFKDCRDLSPALFSELSKFAGFGLVDISHTPINFRTLQRTLRSVRVLHLKCVECPKLATADGGAERRGFAIFAMPDMWMLDGVFITWDERRVWKTGSPIPKDVKTRFVDLIDRELEPFTTGFISSQERKSELSKDNTKKTKIWSPRAREVLEDMPYAFEMGVEEDMARLRVLAMDLERTVARGFGKAVKNPDIMHGCVLEIITGEETYEGRTALNVHGIGSRAILALLLLGTFSPEFGSDSLQRTLETVFITRWDANERHAGGVDHWARPETSPMNWRSENRLTYLALLVGKLTLDSISETSVREAPPLVSPEKLIALGGILRHLLRASYAAKRSRSSGDQPTNEPDRADVARLARSTMSKDHTRQLAALHLDILQLLCLDDRDVRQFCHGFLHMAEVLVAALYALLPQDHPLHSDATSIVDDAKMQCAEDGAATLSLDARALQMKFRMCSLIEDVVAYIDSVQGQE